MNLITKDPTTGIIYLHGRGDQGKSILTLLMSSLNWCVDAREIERANMFFQGVNCYLGVAQVIEIWGMEADHFVEKWLKYRNERKFDAQGFYDSLDSFNQRKLVNWYNDLMIHLSKK